MVQVPTPAALSRTTEIFVACSVSFRCGPLSSDASLGRGRLLLRRSLRGKRPSTTLWHGRKGADSPSTLSCWCERGDSNPHGFPRQILSLVRLPIPPLSQSDFHSLDANACWWQRRTLGLKERTIVPLRLAFFLRDQLRGRLFRHFLAVVQNVQAACQLHEFTQFEQVC